MASNPVAFAFVPVGDEDLDTLADLASEIWHQHFTPIIGEAQVDYMVEKFQSKPAFIHQMAEENYRYVFLVPQEGEGAGQPQGFMGYAPRPEHLDGDGQPDPDMFLSKLYLRQSMRGKGGASQAFGWLVDRTREMGLPCIRLTCNKNNEGSIAVYKHWGFIVEDDDLVTDIGGGFVMDDYGMRYDLEPAGAGSEPAGAASAEATPAGV